MIKGVNRQVVDVQETGSEYFERVIFFVKPEYSGISEGKLREKAQTVIKKTGAPPIKAPEKQERIPPLIKLFLAAASGAGITAIINLIF